jgi:hypothetical protein
MNTQPQPPMPPQEYATQAQPTSTGYATQSQTGNENNLKIVGRVNFPAKQLFEATGFIDTNKQFPIANCFLMFVPGIPDQSKVTGLTYDQSQREIMKIGVRDLFGLAEALIFSATYGQSSDFQIFTDSTKFAGTAEGQGHKKQVSVGAAVGNNGKLRVFLTFNGLKKITIALEKWHAIGLAEQLKTLASETLKTKFTFEQNK